MKLAIASDVHDNMQSFRWFLDYCKQHGVTHCVFLGDIIRPTLAQELFASFEKTYFVFGNNDGDRVRITKFADDSVVLADDCFLEADIADRKLFITHYPLLGRLAAESGRYVVSCYGHNHTFHEERVGECLLVNPGELYGGITGEISFYLYDTERGAGERISR